MYNKNLKMSHTYLNIKNGIAVSISDAIDKLQPTLLKISSGLLMIGFCLWDCGGVDIIKKSSPFTVTII